MLLISKIFNKNPKMTFKWHYLILDRIWETEINIFKNWGPQLRFGPSECAYGLNWIIVIMHSLRQKHSAVPRATYFAHALLLYYQQTFFSDILESTSSLKTESDKYGLRCIKWLSEYSYLDIWLQKVYLILWTNLLHGTTVRRVVM